MVDKRTICQGSSVGKRLSATKFLTEELALSKSIVFKLQCIEKRYHEVGLDGVGSCWESGVVDCLVRVCHEQRLKM